MSLSKTLYPLLLKLVLVQPRKTASRPNMTEKLLTEMLSFSTKTKINYHMFNPLSVCTDGLVLLV